MTSIKTKLRRDGSITYWSVFDQQWRSAWAVPDRELAAMGVKERARVQRFLKRHGAPVAEVRA